MKVFYQQMRLVKEQMSEVSPQKGTKNQPTDKLVVELRIHPKAGGPALCDISSQQKSKRNEDSKHVDPEIAGDGNGEGFKTGNDGLHGPGS